MKNNFLNKNGKCPTPELQSGLVRSKDENVQKPLESQILHRPSSINPKPIARIRSRPEILQVGNLPQIEQSPDSQKEMSKPRLTRFYKRTLYCEDDIRKAIADVKEKKLSRRKASELYGIPRSTLYDKLHGNTKIEMKMGPPTILSAAVEEVVVNFVAHSIKSGSPVTHKIILDFVEDILAKEKEMSITQGIKVKSMERFKRNGGKLRLGQTWLKLFLKRHPEIVLNMQKEATTRETKLYHERDNSTDDIISRSRPEILQAGNLPQIDQNPGSKKKLSKSRLTRFYKRALYCEDDIRKAIADIKEKRLSRKKASELYGIPRSTLYDKLHGNTKIEMKMGPPTLLSSAEEEVVVNYVAHSFKRGSPVTHNTILDFVENILTKEKEMSITQGIELKSSKRFQLNGGKLRPGKKWLVLFLKRHPEIVLNMQKKATTKETKLYHERDISTDDIISEGKTASNAPKFFHVPSSTGSTGTVINKTVPKTFLSVEKERETQVEPALKMNETIQTTSPSETNICSMKEVATEELIAQKQIRTASNAAKLFHAPRSTLQYEVTPIPNKTVPKTFLTEEKERGTQVESVLKMNATTQTTSASEANIWTMKEVAMQALGAQRQIISKGCDDAVLCSPRFLTLLFNKREKWIQFMLEVDFNSKRSGAEVFVALPNEAEPAIICKMEIEKDTEFKDEPINMNWKEDPSSHSIKTQDNLIFERSQEDEISLGVEELLTPSNKVDFGDIRDQGDKVVHMELLDSSTEMGVDVTLHDNSLQHEFSNRGKTELNPPLDLAWDLKDSHLFNEEWEDENHSQSPKSSESNLERVLFQIKIEQDFEIKNKSTHLNWNENPHMNREQNMKWATESTTKDELRTTFRENKNKYPFLKDCFVSVKRLPRELAVADILKSVAANVINNKKDMEIMGEPIDLNLSNASHISTKPSPDRLTEETDPQKEINPKSARKRSESLVSVDDVCSSRKRIKLCLEPSANDNDAGNKSDVLSKCSFPANDSDMDRSPLQPVPPCLVASQREVSKLANDSTTPLTEPDGMSVMYKIIKGATERKKPRLLDNIGYSYTVRSYNKDGTTNWRCDIRNTNINCPATVKQIGENKFEKGTREHTHVATKHKMVKKSTLFRIPKYDTL